MSNPYEDWALKLDQKYPLMFEPCFDFSCGWKSLVTNLVKQIHEVDDRVTIAQIKEKFGTLRFYLANCPEESQDAVYALIRAAEQASAVTCEDCEAPGTLDTRRFWVRTLCPNCKAKRE